jgi:hypothetical protein
VAHGAPAPRVAAVGGELYSASDARAAFSTIWIWSLRSRIVPKLRRAAGTGGAVRCFSAGGFLVRWHPQQRRRRLLERPPRTQQPLAEERRP